MASVLIPLPRCDFDPTEAGVAWHVLQERGHIVQFATPDGLRPEADERVVSGRGFGPWKRMLRADAHGLRAYEAMQASDAFNRPLRYDAVEGFDALVLPGGHAPGMREYLESNRLQRLVSEAFAKDLPVGAICHGVVLAARSRDANGRSVLYRRSTTALTRILELTAWGMTTPWLGNYYRTYPCTVQDEVTAALEHADQFKTGPLPLLRDTPAHRHRGFTVRDGSYLSARWPGDAHRFAYEFADLLATRNGGQG